MQKTIYITGAGVISAQETFGHRNLPTAWRNEETLQLRAIDPNYKDFVPADMLRRMSHIIKMGVAAGKTALKDAQIE
ncbi:MAG: 3-oxoacyl-ACP synthase, partial [Bacteroidetes bacterium]|nr:3-oxoacyl-ACP synthase [Bacteroidota bacterium]